MTMTERRRQDILATIRAAFPTTPPNSTGGDPDPFSIFLQDCFRQMDSSLVEATVSEGVDVVEICRKLRPEIVSSSCKIKSRK